MTRKALGSALRSHPCTSSSSFLQRVTLRNSQTYSHSTTCLSVAMPPRKKAKASAASTPLGDGQPGTPQASGALAQDELLNDPWEDEQEIQLLKSMMKWKPTGEQLKTKT